MAYKSGIFILTSAFSKNRLRALLTHASTIVSNKLYLKLSSSLYQNPCIWRWRKYISICYSTASIVCPSVDVCLLLPRSAAANRVSSKNREFQVVITDSTCNDDQQTLQIARSVGSGGNVVVWSDLANVIDEDDEMESDQISASYQSVCLGGTFDQLHNGHRILLSVSALLSERKLLVGVTDRCMLKTKLLAPLVQTYDTRCAVVAQFLLDIDYPLEQVKFSRLTDPFGPPLHDPDYDCIIASPEVIPGCTKINELRKKNNLKTLAIECISFAKNPDTETLTGSQSIVPLELKIEEKLSSSTLRLQLLGSILHPETFCGPERHREGRPWVIGLTGPAGAGKSTITLHLTEYGRERVHIIHADQLAHQLYEPGKNVYNQLIDCFAPAVIISVASPYNIDRRKLGELVFNDSNKLQLLNSILWPEITSLVEQEISRIKALKQAHLPIVVIDAALLFDAGWHTSCDEVWTAYVPRGECEMRLAERHCISLEQAQSRVDAQSLSIKQAVGDEVVDWWTPCQRDAYFGPISKSNVVFCSQWDVSFTRSQVKKAWDGLLKRIDAIQNYN